MATRVFVTTVELMAPGRQPVAGSLSRSTRAAPQQEKIEKYLEADPLDDYGFSDWVGLELHGLGADNTGMVKDPFTADETIALLRRFAAEESSRSQSVYGACGLPGSVQAVAEASSPTMTRRPSGGYRCVCGSTGGSPHSDPA
jgi:hypothetical protein